MKVYRVYARASGYIEIEVRAKDRESAIEFGLDYAYGSGEAEWDWVDVEELTE